ncbi:hypothetical protein LTR99_011139 [Exophiala xenobiotica]|uniref:Uncharacterized protein n=1 Tax=Vermiconidia calcicola TaxID=1690605 RepID=A0AAV9PTD9_9PEZI|nr:hypothetical protein LTR99_011139 [Exophiala xenobiotica]KAK5425401.1 hypothetical protein LTR34_011145 [Exophiala xenobiotica]KAK5431413.1 hypothetical protein LTR18_011386 [Exophiala xenobiotica]KAK5527510.1 hypothetical protein LTR25_011123 [Vermiconidia calcicola]KAK5528501.1 hypothetical protein LTR23_011027 [Chaetothyriales sp. CCFEE 6169]
MSDRRDVSVCPSRQLLRIDSGVLRISCPEWGKSPNTHCKSETKDWLDNNVGPRKSSHGRFSGIESAQDGSSFRSIPALAGADKMVETRNAVEDIWGERKPYKHVWPDRVDQFTIEDPEKWVQSACVMCRLFGSYIHNEILLIYFAAMGVD